MVGETKVVYLRAEVDHDGVIKQAELPGPDLSGNSAIFVRIPMQNAPLFLVTVYHENRVDTPLSFLARIAVFQHYLWLEDLEGALAVKNADVVDSVLRVTDDWRDSF